MVVQGAAEAKAMFARACDCRDYSAEIFPLNATFDGILAIGSRAPLQVLFVVDVGTREKHLVSACYLVISISQLLIQIP